MNANADGAVRLLQDFKHRSISDKLEYLYSSQSSFWQEQRKAALRKVQLELDEADDVVHSRYLNSKLRIDPGHSAVG